MIRSGIEIDEFLHKAARYLYGDEGTFFDTLGFPGFEWAPTLPGEDSRFLRRRLILPPPKDELEIGAGHKRIVTLRNLIAPPSFGDRKDTPDQRWCREDSRGFQWVREVHLQNIRDGKMWACAHQGYQFHVTEGNTWAEMDVIQRVALAKSALWNHVL